MKNTLRRFKHLATLLCLITCALFVVAACGSDDDDKTNVDQTNNDITRYDVNGGAITVSYNGKTHTADRDTGGQITRMALYNQLTTSFSSHWGEEGKLPYSVSTVVTMTEEPGKDIISGEYTIFDQDEILLQNARFGSISLYSADLHEGLKEPFPSSLTAVSGTIKYELIDTENNGQKTAIYTFDGDFLSDKEGDDTTYKVSGKLTADHQLLN